MSETCGSNAGDVSPEQQVRALYTELALHPEKEFGWGRGKDNARGLGYDEIWLERLPAAVWESSAAVGNPFSIGPIRPGEIVIDLGCGAGADVCIAALLVGAHGQVIGVDLTSAMVVKARDNARLAGLHNVTIHEADMARLPMPDAFADVVISNGSINLSPRKACVLKEAGRVLKIGGRLHIADVVRNNTSEHAQCGSANIPGSWANCVAGTLGPESVVEMLQQAGFADVQLVGMTGYRTSPETVGALFRARKATL
jgi:arsenite methyltransferase